MSEVNQNDQKIVNELDFDGDGWYIKVGQIYSSPYYEYHIRIERIELDGENRDNAKVFYRTVDANDYSSVSETENWHRAWHINDGTWDLEVDVVVGAAQYDQEVYERWKLVLFDENSDVESPYYDREITVAMAAEEACKRGYHSFEIVHCVETVKRYTVNPTPDK